LVNGVTLTNEYDGDKLLIWKISLIRLKFLLTEKK
jgi:hypothetical protein